MAVTIVRTPWIDDDGTGTTGTVINNAEKTTLYNQIDAALAQLLPAASLSLVGTPYTPVLGSLSGAVPVLGNGTARGRYAVVGPVLNFVAGFTLGSTSVMGSGNLITISIPPVPPYAQSPLPPQVLVTATLAVISAVGATQAALTLFCSGNAMYGNFTGDTYPLAPGWSLAINGTYLIG